MSIINSESLYVNEFPPLEIVRDDAKKRWGEVFQQLAPELSDAIYAARNNHVTCPLPQLDDLHPSFRIDDLSIGSAICTCGQWANGFLLLQDLKGWTQQESVAAVHASLRQLGPPLPMLDPPDAPTRCEYIRLNTT